MPTIDTPTAEGATNVLLNQRSLDPPYYRQAVGIQGDENAGKAIGFDADGILGAISVAVDVKSFGAKFDGITDDTAAIQAAVDAEDVILLPLGTAKITAPIIIPAGIPKQFVGAGFCKSILKAYGTFNAVIQIGDATAQTERSIFKDFSITCDDAAVVQYGIYGARAAHTTFDKIQVQGMATAGVSTGYGFCNNYLGCEFSYNAGSGVLLNDDYDAANNIVNFYGCIILLNGGWGIKMFSGTSVHIHGCTIESNQKGGVYAGSLHALTIEDSYFESNASVGETFTTPAVTVKTNILLNGNVLPGVLNSAYPSTSVVISGNYTSDSYAGSFIYSPGVKSLSVKNNFVNPETPVPLLDPASLCDGISVHGNENFTTALTGGCCLHAGGVNQDIKLLASGTGAIMLDSKAVANQNLIANANVGIGTPTPSSLLHVKGGAGTGLKIETTGAYSIFDFSSPSGQVLLVPVNGTLSIQTGGAGAAAERVVVNEIGGVTIKAGSEFTGSLTLPSMTKVQRNALTAVNGMMVYQTDATPGLRVRENGVWVKYTATADA